ncbi:hypothetical protein BV898_06178 [Hypsibius exemplaris]|uniref:Uncharacterized protein n=1 Tax=Hypsibius exemplaris TaxID=2072580 RepID=A0A1W0WXH3_HYPEX|nr:hypothetical protein BV898_06178 [Hypsibius exemplaris]
MDNLPRTRLSVTFLACFAFGTVSSLTCITCKNYGSFFTSPVLNTLDCTNSSNWLEVTCDGGVQFCLKLQGAIYGSLGALPQPNTLDGVQRGCAPPRGSLLNSSEVTRPSGSSFRDSAGCTKGDKYIKAPYRGEFSSSNLAPVYQFNGYYCLCAGERCNGAVAKTGNVALLSIAATAASLLLGRFLV